MILILGEDKDVTTNLVCDWLDNLKKPFYRVNISTINQIVEFNFNSNKLGFEIKNNIIGNIRIDKITSVWFRRGYFNFEPRQFISEDFNPYINNQIDNHLNLEVRTCFDFLYKYLIKNKKVIGDFYNSSVNKLDVLLEAKKCELNIPETLVTTKKSVAFDFIKKHEKVVCKSIRENLSANDNQYNLFYLNQLYELKDLEIVPENFEPTLFQKYIEKKFEIRIFFFEDNYYAMSIFSQRDKQTQVDYRNYNYKTPNRNIPFNLPSLLIEKLKILVNRINLRSGSIDMIYSKDNHYTFLEVNPVGQFGVVSKSCNYYLEKKIAEIL